MAFNYRPVSQVQYQPVSPELIKMASRTPFDIAGEAMSKMVTNVDNLAFENKIGQAKDIQGLTGLTPSTPEQQAMLASKAGVFSALERQKAREQAGKFRIEDLRYRAAQDEATAKYREQQQTNALIRQQIEGAKFNALQEYRNKVLDQQKKIAGLKNNADINKVLAKRNLLLDNIKLAKEQGNEEKVDALNAQLKAFDTENSNLFTALGTKQPSQITTQPKKDDFSELRQGNLPQRYLNESGEIKSEYRKKAWDAATKFEKVANNLVDKQVNSIFADMIKVDENNIARFDVSGKNSKEVMSIINKKVKNLQDYLKSDAKISKGKKKLAEEKISDIKSAFVNRNVSDMKKEFLNKYEKGNEIFRQNIDGMVKDFYESNYTGLGETFTDWISGRNAEETFTDEILPYLNMVMVAEGKGKFNVQDFYDSFENKTYYKQKKWDINAPFGLEEGEEVMQHPITDALKQVPALRESFPQDKSFGAKWIDSWSEGIGKRAMALGETGGDALSWIVQQVKESTANKSLKERQELLKKSLQYYNSNRER